jgi:hypothetical protein
VSGGDDKILYFWDPLSGNVTHKIELSSPIITLIEIDFHLKKKLVVGTRAGVQYIHIDRSGLKFAEVGEVLGSRPALSIVHITGTRFIAILYSDGKVTFHDFITQTNSSLSLPIAKLIDQQERMTDDYSALYSVGELIYIKSKQVLFFARRGSKLYSWTLSEQEENVTLGLPATIKKTPFQNFSIPRQDFSLGRAAYVDSSHAFLLLLNNGVFLYNFRNFETVNFYGECYRECPSGFFPDANKICKKCSKECKTCEQRNDRCVICSSADQYQLDGKCHETGCPKNSELISVKNRICQCQEDFFPQKGACVEEDDFPEDKEKFLAWMIGSVIIGLLSLSLCLYCVFMFYEDKRNPKKPEEFEEEPSHGSIAQESDRENERNGEPIELETSRANTEQVLPPSNQNDKKLEYSSHETLYKTPRKLESVSHEEWCFPARTNSKMTEEK